MARSDANRSIMVIYHGRRSQKTIIAAVKRKSKIVDQLPMGSFTCASRKAQTNDAAGPRTASAAAAAGEQAAPTTCGAHTSAQTRGSPRGPRRFSLSCIVRTATRVAMSRTTCGAWCKREPPQSKSLCKETQKHMLQRQAKMAELTWISSSDGEDGGFRHALTSGLEREHPFP